MGFSKPAGKSFESFHASSLYCPKCRQAVPVREKLLLILPDGQLFDYVCVYCATSVGTKHDKVRQEARILMPGSFS
jgi:hypothetical protein